MVAGSDINIYSRIAKITFFLYFFFTLFGTALPFRKGVSDPSEIGTANIVNQIVFTILFITSILSLLPKSNQVILIIKREKFLALFLLWCILSIFWSDHSLVSFKRLFQIYTGVLVCLSFLLHSDSVDEVLSTLKILFSIYMIVSLVSIFTIPGATSSYGAWKGLATGKNHMGQASLISLLIWVYSFKDKRIKSQLFYLFMLIVSLILLFGSQSATAITTLLLLILVGFLFSVDKLFESIGIRRTFSIITMIFLGSIIVSIYLLYPDLISSLFLQAGRDLTFTGRTELWADILEEAKKHLLLGCGYQAYWVLDSDTILALYQTYLWLPNQAHNGYVDILNETGLVGLFLVMAIIINYFFHLVKFKEVTYWKWFIIVALIINLQESTLFRPKILLGFIFVFFYFALFTDLLRDKQSK